MRFVCTYSLFTVTFSLGLFTARYVFPYIICLFLKETISTPGIGKNVRLIHSKKHSVFKVFCAPGVFNIPG